MTKISLFNLINNAIIGLVEFSKDFIYKNIMQDEETTTPEGVEVETPVEMPMGEEEVTPEGEMPSEATEEEAM